MSAQGEITDFLRTLVSEDGKFVPMTPNQIALQTGISRQQVNKTLYNLASRSRIELQRGANGRDIVGVKPLDLAPRQRGRSPSAPRRVRYAAPVAAPSGERRRTSISTPSLDEYARAKSRFEQMQNDLGDLVEATFRGNPYAEEGIRLRDRLVSVEQQLIDVRRERDEYEHDLRSIRARKQADLRESAERDGSLATSGD